MEQISQVTWVEHNLVPNGPVHDMFKMLLTSNYAFNAKRWMSTLQRYCDQTKGMDGEGENNSPGPNGVIILSFGF